VASSKRSSAAVSGLLLALFLRNRVSGEITQKKSEEDVENLLGPFSAPLYTL
jgi:hypothetical protein